MTLTMDFVHYSRIRMFLWQGKIVYRNAIDEKGSEDEE